MALKGGVYPKLVENIISEYGEPVLFHYTERQSDGYGGFIESEPKALPLRGVFYSSSSGKFDFGEIGKFPRFTAAKDFSILLSAKDGKKIDENMKVKRKVEFEKESGERYYAEKTFKVRLVRRYFDVCVQVDLEILSDDEEGAIYEMES